MTAVVDPPAVTAEAPSVPAEARIVTVFANLLPDEVIASRRLKALKRRLIAAVVLLVGLLVAGYAYSWWETSQADDDLAYEQFQGQQSTQQLTTYGPLLQAQGAAAAIQGQLATVMARDLQWSELIARLRRSAPAGLQVTQFSGSTKDSTTTALSPSGVVLVGQLNLSGTAHDFRDVATYVDTLTKLKGLAVVNPGSITDTAGGLTFSITVSLTSDALGGRFTPKTTAPAPSPSSTGGS